MKNHKLGFSLLSVDPFSLKEKIIEIKNNRIDFFHIDIMDGNFVPNISFSPHIVTAISKIAEGTPLDIHFMTTEKAFNNIIDAFLETKPKFISVHLEAFSNINSIKKIIKDNNVNFGLALNPATEIKTLYPFLDNIDFVLLMSVVPGFGGQKFIDSTFKKITELNNIKMNNKYDFLVEVDGGINLRISC